MIILSNEYWLHTYEIMMPEHVKMPNIGTCHHDNATCLLISHVLSNINTIRSETSIRLNSTIETVKRLIPEARIRASRSKRSLLPFIGDLSRSLFGTATTDDVNMLARHINALNRESRGLATALAQHENHLSSFMVKANHRMDQLMQGVKDNYIAINYIHTQLSNTVRNLEESFQQMISLLSLQIQSASHINHELDEFKKGISDLVNGKLSPLILQQTVLEATLNDIQHILNTKYPGFYLSQTTSDIYAASNFLYARNNTKIYLTLKIPISHFKEPLTVYKIKSLPVPINSTSAHATQLLNIPDNLILTKKQQFYATLSNSQLARCKGGKVKHCSFNLALTPVTTESCILSLYLNSKAKVKSLCDFRFLHNIVESRIIELNPSSLILYQTPLLSMQCGNEHKMLKGCDFCIIKVPCQCSFTTPNFFLAPRLTTCHNTSRDVTKVHPVNLALMQNFFDNSKLEHIFADTTFSSPINMSIPNFKLYNHDMHNIMADDKQSHLSLSRMAEAAKKDAKIFQSLAEPLLDGQISIQTQWPDLNAILVLITMSTTAISIMLLVWTFFKIRKLSAAILVLQQCKGIKSMSTTLPSFIYDSQAPPKSFESTSFDFISLEWDHAIVALILLMFLFLVYFFYTVRNKQNNPTLCLEITNTKRSILVDLIKLPLCPSHCKTSAPDSISDVDITGHWLAPRLKIQWLNFTMVNKMSNKQIELPACIGLTLRQAQRIKKIMKRPFFVFLYLKHYDLLIPLQNTSLMV